MRRKRLIFAGTGLMLVALALAGGFVFLRTKRTKASEPVPAQQIQASLGTLSTTVVGTGNLQSAKAQEVLVSSGLTIETVCVEVGDTVCAGDVLATVNQTVLTAEIAQMQSAIAEMDEQLQQIQAETGEEESQSITSKVEGRVKKIYAEAGDLAADVMVSDGALLLLSLDGKMAVQIETDSDVEAGSAVTVTLSDETVVSAVAESRSGSTMTVTLTDNGTDFGDLVTVKDSSGQVLGTGTLFIHQPLEITGTSGQISTVHVTENQWVEAKDALFTLADAPVSAKYQEILAARSVYKEKLKELLAMAEDGVITASLDGVIESVGLTTGSTTAASSDAEQNNASAEGTGIPASKMTFSAGKGISVLKKLSTEFSQPNEESGFSENQKTAPIHQTEAESQEAQETPETETPSAPDSQEKKQEESQKEQQEREQANAQYEITEDELSRSEQENTSVPQTDVQSSSQERTDFSQNSQNTDITPAAAEVSYQMVSSNSAQSNADNSSFQVPDTQGLQEQITGFTISVQNEMILSVEIDELDILSVDEGQEVQITLDALEGERFTGTVSQVSDSTSGSDGSAKYTVEVTLPKADSMRVGMSASATIVTEKKENVVVVPADVVQERGRQVFVYTQYDAESGVLSGETEVQTGISDGEKVEITSGLSEGDTVYYQRQESQSSQEKRQEKGQEMPMNGMFEMDRNGGGRQQEGGGMPDGGMPGGMGGPGGQ